MGIASTIAIIGFVLLILVVFIVSVIHPFWCILDCAISKAHSDGKKIVWILITFFTWSLGAVLYGLLGTDSRLLRRTTVLCLVLAILGAGISVGAVILNPAIKQVFLPQILSRFQQKSSLSFLPTSSVNAPAVPQTETDIDLLKIDAMTKRVKDDFAGEIAIYSKILETHPNDIDSLVNRGYAKIRSGNSAEGQADILAGVNLATNQIATAPTAVLYHSRGMGYRYLQKYDEATQDIKKAIEMDPAMEPEWKLDLAMVDVDRQMTAPKKPTKAKRTVKKK